MDMNDIIKSIPSVVASLYENIYVFNLNQDKSYRVQYSGEKLTVSSPKTLNDLKNDLGVFRENLVDEIINELELKKVLITKDNKEKLVVLTTNGDYKLLFITDITLNKNLGEDKKILLIADDSPVITKFFTKTFMDEYNVLVAQDGNEAIKLIEEYIDKPLVGAFLDLQMPNKNGFEVLEYFKENNLFAKIPVSIISGEDSLDGIEKATAYGIVDMLQKPFNADAAKAIVDKTIRFSPKINN